MMGKDPVPRSSLGKCLDFNETKKIVAVGVLSTHLSLSLSNGCCDKMGQGFPSSRLVPPHPVLRPAPCSFPAPVENGCHTNKNDTSVDNLRKQTIKSCWLASSFPWIAVWPWTQAGFTEHIWPLNVWPIPWLQSSVFDAQWIVWQLNKI